MYRLVPPPQKSGGAFKATLFMRFDRKPLQKSGGNFKKQSRVGPPEKGFSIAERAGYTGSIPVGVKA